MNLEFIIYYDKHLMTTLEEQLIEESKDSNLTKVKELIENGADVNAKNNNGSTPLHFSTWKGHTEVCRLLLENGADVNAKNNYGCTPLRFSPWSAQRGHLEVCRLFLENGADVNAKDNDGWTPLHWSVWKGHLEVCRLLLENGADINAKTDDGNTALHWSARWSHTVTARLLLEYKADVNAKNNDGITPLHRNAQYGHMEVCRLLLEYGADQSDLFEKWSKKRIAKEFLELPYCNPSKKHTNELCSVSFELPKEGDWYIVWEDDSITIFENVHLASVEPELIKGVYIQC